REVVHRDGLVGRVGEDADGEDSEAQVERLEVVAAPPPDPFEREEAWSEKERDYRAEELRVEARQLLRGVVYEVAHREVARVGSPVSRTGMPSSTSACGRGMTWVATTSPTRRAAAAPASTAAFTAPTSPRTMAVTSPASIFS